MSKTFSLETFRKRPNRRTGLVRGSFSAKGRVVLPTAFQEINGISEKQFYMLYFDPHVDVGGKLRQVLAVTFHDKDSEGYYRLQRVKGTGYVETRALLREEGFAIRTTGKVDLKWDGKQRAVFIDLTDNIDYDRAVKAVDEIETASFPLEKAKVHKKKQAGRPRDT